MSGWSVSRPVAFVLIAAAVFRAVYLSLYATHSLFFDAMLLDSQAYDTWARVIASGHLIGTEAFYFPPLYPYLLGALFKIAGHSYALVYVAQALLGLVNILLTYRAGQRLFGERAGLLAAAGAALYAPFVFFETKVLGTTLGLTLNLTALLLLVGAEERPPAADGDWRAWLAPGLAIGAAALCLPATILLALLYGVRLARRDLRCAAALLLAAGAMLLPVLAHNLYVASDPLFLSAQGGITFYQGNNHSALGLYASPPGFTGSPDTQAMEEKTIAERETGRPLKRSEISAHFFGKGLDFIVGAPGDWLWLEARKLGYLFGNYEASTEYSFDLERRQIRWLWAPFLPFAAICGLGIAGLWTSGAAGRRAGRATHDGPDWSPAAALLLYALYASAVPLMFYMSSRYRLPLVPALLIYGGVFLDRLPEALRSGGRRRATYGAAAMAATVLAFLSSFVIAPVSDRSEANIHYNIGRLLLDRGQNEAAVAEFDQALAGWPTHFMALINRGNALDALGRTEDALASYRRSEEIKPNFWTAYKNAGLLLYRARRYEEAEATFRRGLAAGESEARYLLAVVLQQEQREDEAVEMLQDALRMNPRESRAHTRLGEILAKRGDAEGARAHFRQALAVNPSDTSARDGLARLGG